MSSLITVCHFVHLLCGIKDFYRSRWCHKVKCLVWFE